jgi:hypothetical protein
MNENPFESPPSIKYECEESIESVEHHRDLEYPTMFLTILLLFILFIAIASTEVNAIMGIENSRTKVIK